MKDLMVMMMMMMYSIRFNSRKQDGMLRGWYMLSVKNIFRLCGLRTVFVISPFLPSPLSSPFFSPLMFHSLLIGLMKTGCNLTIPNMLSEIKLEVVEYWKWKAKRQKQVYIFCLYILLVKLLDKWAWISCCMVEQRMAENQDMHQWVFTFFR